MEETLLKGFTAKDLVDYQRLYFECLKSRCSIHTWGNGIFRAAWAFVFLWDKANKKHRKTPMSADLKGQAVLDIAIRKEMDIGLSRLPTRLRHFAPPPRQTNRFEEKLIWAVHRAQQRCTNDPDLLVDEFSYER